MIKLLITDDNPIIRIGLKTLLRNEMDIIIAGEADNSEEMFGFLQHERCDLLVMNTLISCRNGYNDLDRLKKTYPDLPILLLSMYSEGIHELQVFELGVKGYLDKLAIQSEFIKAIRNVANGGLYISEAYNSKLLLYMNRYGKKTLSHNSLTKRELQVMCMIASGKAQKDISDTLCISEKTVSTHKKRILDKLNLTSNFELIRYAIENDFITQE